MAHVLSSTTGYALARSNLLFRLSEYDILTSERRLEFLGLIVGTYSLTILYVVLMRVIESGFDTFAYIQLSGDLIVSAILIVLTGGMESLFLVLLPLCVLAGSVLLYRAGSLYTMLICGRSHRPHRRSRNLGLVAAEWPSTRA